MTLNMLATYILADDNSGSISNILKGASNKLQEWGQWFLVVIGVAMVIYGVFQIAKGMMSGGRGQTNWVMAIGCIIVGGLLSVSGGWNFISNMASGSGKEIQNMSTTKTNDDDAFMSNNPNKTGTETGTIIIGDLLCTFDE